MSLTLERKAARNSGTIHGPCIKALLFDVDGVLADTASLHRKAWARIASEEGFAFDDACAESLRGLSREDSLRRILNGRELNPDQFQRLMERKNSYYVDSLKTLKAGDVLTGVPELISDARTAGMAVAAVSASRNAKTVILGVGLYEYLDAIVDGNIESDGENRYVLAARRLEVPNSHCVVFEDSRAGLELARSAEMFTIGLGAHSYEAADVILPSLENCTLNELTRRLSAKS